MEDRLETCTVLIWSLIVELYLLYTPNKTIGYNCILELTNFGLHFPILKIKPQIGMEEFIKVEKKEFQKKTCMSDTKT